MKAHRARAASAQARGREPAAGTPTNFRHYAPPRLVLPIVPVPRTLARSACVSRCRSINSPFHPEPCVLSIIPEGTTGARSAHENHLTNASLLRRRSIVGDHNDRGKIELE